MKVEIKITPEVYHGLMHLADDVNQVINEWRIPAAVLEAAVLSFVTTGRFGRFHLKHCNRWVRIISVESEKR